MQNIVLSTLFSCALIAGSTLAFACYELARNPDVQDKLRYEIEDLVEPDKNISYDEIQSMSYLDQIISETLRFHNPAAILTRSALKDYKIPGSEIIIEEGKFCWINSIGVHFNPKYYETPEVFNPDHFTKEAKANRNP